MQQKSPVLTVNNLVKTFPSRITQQPFVAVDHLTFALQRGEILGVLGPNGAGKTTTMQILLSTLTRTSGDIHYFGKEFDRYRSEILMKVSFASSYINLPGHLTVYENLLVQGMLHGMKKAQLKENIDHFLNFFNLYEKRKHEVITLSAGQKTRTMLCKAFITNPEIVLLDEPTASLDVDVADQVRKFILEEQRRRQLSILFTSHNMDEVASVCNRVLVLKEGKLIANDKPEKLAASVSTTRVLLTPHKDEVERFIAFAREHKIPYSFREPALSFEVHEQQIAAFLTSLAEQGLRYNQIAIEKPSLEDYFMRLTHPAAEKE